MLKMKHDKDWFYSHIGDSSVHVLLSVGGNFGVVKGVRAAAHVVVPEAIETRLLWSCLIDFFTSEHAELHILQNTSEILGEKIFNAGRILILIVHNNNKNKSRKHNPMPEY